MQATLLNISQPDTNHTGVPEVQLSFKPFVNYLKSRIDNEDTVKKEFFSYVLQRFLDADQLRGDISMEEVIKYKEELSLVYSLLMPVIAEETNSYWALGLPVTPSVFYGTNVFYDLLRDQHSGEMYCDIVAETNWEEHAKQKLQIVYSFVLRKIFGIVLPEKSEMVHSMEDKVTGMPRYYHVNLDPRFVEVKVIGDLPEINFESFQRLCQVEGHINWDAVFTMIPLSLFRFEGFSIITLTDITASQVLENIKELLLDQPDYDSQEYYDKIMGSLKALSEKQQLSFDMLPALRINDKLVFNEEVSERSLMVRSLAQAGKGKEEFAKLAEAYLADPKVFFYRDLASADTQVSSMIEVIKDTGIASYALMPVYYNNKVAGVLEVYTTEKDVLDENVMARVEQATPLLAQLLQRNIEEFNAKITGVIRNRFTSIQPAVQWKFNEVAFQYLKRKKESKEPADDIYFRDVFPLYGAIDIRNSTQERNLALRADLTKQIQLLIETLGAIMRQEKIAIADELIFKCRKWEDRLEQGAMDDDHSKVQDFLDYEVEEFLRYFKESGPELCTVIQKYYADIDQETGIAFANRRNLETSMQMINNAINHYLEFFKDETQRSYPCYFEKFRTDGVEFDIYIGQSITPLKPFNPLYLKNIRLSQVTAMAAMAKLTHALLPELGRKLETTQLVFIHSNSINISFRNDERRFDVEGAYNIRYQVIKKRIDKVLIRDTHERLTQPGKIALVYFSKKEADEYTGYINYLQEQKLLLDDTEHLELEELQGISGLKAMRVSVNLD
jgi:hypothetical protein